MRKRIRSCRVGLAPPPRGETMKLKVLLAFLFCPNALVLADNWSVGTPIVTYYAGPVICQHQRVGAEQKCQQHFQFHRFSLRWWGEPHPTAPDPFAHRPADRARWELDSAAGPPRRSCIYRSPRWGPRRSAPGVGGPG